MIKARWIQITARVLLAVVFLLSGVAKLVAIDQFELYIFSFLFLPLSVVYVIARLCIAAELTLAVLIAIGWFPRTVRIVTVMLLVAFSLFLGYAALSGHDESCQCFGKLADMPPAVSLLKNAILIVTALLLSTQSKQPKSLTIWLTVAVAIAITVSVFCISVPDSWLFGKEEMRYDEQLLDDVLEDHNLDEGNYLVAFITPGCPFCQMAKEKIGSIERRHKIEDGFVRFIEPKDIGSHTFLKLTGGARPFVFLVKDGVVKATYHYRNISEKEISETIGHKVAGSR